MRLTPIDIRKQQFRKGMRGYDVDEVDTFMAMIADEMEELIGAAQKSKTEVDALKERLAEYQQMEATMRETLVTVQNAAEQKRDAAKKEADMIIKEAEVQASKWVEEAHKSVREVKRELVRLGGMRDSYVSRLKMLMQAQLDMLKMIEKDEENPEETLNMFEERLASLGASAAQPEPAPAPVEKEEPPPVEPVTPAEIKALPGSELESEPEGDEEGAMLDLEP